MKDLLRSELMNIDGGNVPVAFYMDNDVIKANGNNMANVGPIYFDVFKAFVRDIMKGIFL